MSIQILTEMPNNPILNKILVIVRKHSSRFGVSSDLGAGSNPVAATQSKQSYTG